MLDPYILWSFAAFLLCLLFSAFFSSMETSLFSLTRSQIDELSDSDDEGDRRLYKLLSEPRKLLVVILSGNTVVNVVAATVVALVIERLFGGGTTSRLLIVMIEVVLVTLVILIFGEVLPKLMAIRQPLAWSSKMAGVLVVVGWLLYPITFLLLPITELVAKTLNIEKRRLWISEEEIKTLVEVGEEHGALEKSEKELIHSIFEFGDTTVKEIMVPRTDMIALEISTPIEKVIETVRKYGHSRIPIYQRTVDNVVGILHAKDLLPYYPFKEEFDLRPLLRKPFFVPEAKLIHELLKEFQEQRVHLAIAVDEHGGTAGMVTLENVIEEIAGEIQDEHDIEQPLWAKVDDRTVMMEAKMDVETVNEILADDVIPTDEDFETLGGFLLAELGEFPEVKTKVEYHNYEFIVEEIRAHRLGRIRIIKHEPLGDSES